MNKTVRIIFFVVAFVIIIILVWCHRVFCRRNEKSPITTPRLLIKKNWNRRQTRPVSASPLRDLQSNRERSASYLPLISPHSSKPPPLGFKYSANIPQPEVSKTIGFSNHVDAYPSTSGAPYPTNMKSNRDSCPSPTCYSATQSTPYPLFNIMPRPSTSKTAYPPERLRSETPDSIGSIHYPPTPAATHSVSNGSIIQISSRTSYPLELNADKVSDCTNITPHLCAHEAPYPVPSISAMTQHSFLTPYSPEHTPFEIVDSTRNVLSAPMHEAPHQLFERSSLPPFTTTEGLLEHNTHCNRTTSYPPSVTTSLSVEQRPPSYSEAVHNKF